jgi:hypothetical protein
LISLPVEIETLAHFYIQYVSCDQKFQKP